MSSVIARTSTVREVRGAAGGVRGIPKQMEGLYSARRPIQFSRGDIPANARMGIPPSSSGPCSSRPG